MRAFRLLPLLLAAAGCGVEFTPRSVVVDTRVLAITATPLEVGPTDSVTLTAWRVGPPHDDPAAERIVAESWSFCPFSIGSTAGYACAVPECEFDVTPPGLALPALYGPSEPMTATPGALAQQCLALLSSAGALPAGVPAQLPPRVEVLFRYKVTAAGSREREAVQRIPVYLAGVAAGLPTGQAPNVPPDIMSVEIGGIPVQPMATYTGTDPELAAGAELPVNVTLRMPESAQTYVEGDRTLTEQLVVSFYTTAGRFDYDWANGPDASVKLKGEDLPAGANVARVWVVARDLRGGEAIDGPFRVRITP